MKRLDCIVWEVTLKCNAKCIHCGSSAGDLRDQELSTEEVLNICEQIAELECPNVNLIGGELFLRKDWKQIISALSSKGINISIITNGLCLTEDNLAFLSEAGIKSLGISIDGGTVQTNDYIRQVPGLFDKIMQAAENSTKYDFELCSISTLNKLNILELGEMRRIFSEKPFKVWQIQIASPHGRMTKDLILDDYEYYIASVFIAKSRKIIPKSTLAIVCNHDFGYYSKTIPRHTIYDKWIGCPGGLTTLGIRSDGKVQGCLSLDYNNFAEYDLTKKSLAEIWQDKGFCKWNYPKEKASLLENFCQTCEYGTVCLAGCSDSAHSLSGSPGYNPQCHHRIETEWQHVEPKQDFDFVFQGLTQGKVDEDGRIYLYKTEPLTTALLDDLKLESYQRQLLELIVDD